MSSLRLRSGQALSWRASRAPAVAKDLLGRSIKLLTSQRLVREILHDAARKFLRFDQDDNGPLFRMTVGVNLFIVSYRSMLLLLLS